MEPREQRVWEGEGPWQCLMSWSQSSHFLQEIDFDHLVDCQLPPGDWQPWNLLPILIEEIACYSYTSTSTSLLTSLEECKLEHINIIQG